MPRTAFLLRGVNVGGHGKVPMTALRDALTAAGFTDVVTYLQSGNVVAASHAKPYAAAESVATVIRETFGLDVAVLARTHTQLAAIVANNPLPEGLADRSRLGVGFLSAKPSGDRLAFDAAALLPEKLVAAGREIYVWCPDGFGRSELLKRVSDRKLGVTVTMRNWNTVTKLLELTAPA